MKYHKVLASIIICLGVACTRNPAQESKLSSADDAYNESARAFERSAQDLENAARDMENQAGTVSSEISRVQSSIQDAQSFLATADSQLSEVQRQEADARQKAASYRADEARFQAEALAYEKKKASLLDELKAMTQDVYILENKIALKKEQKENVAAYRQALKDFEATSQKLSLAVGEISRLSTLAENAHAAWMEDFRRLSLEKKPDFPQIRDRASYQSAILAVNEFKLAIPKTSEVLSLESRFSAAVESYNQVLGQYQEVSAKISSSKDFAAYSYLSGDKSPLGKLDQIAASALDVKMVADQQRKFHDQRSERREYLTRAVPTAWEKLVKTYLQENNVAIGIELIKDIDRVLSEEYFYNSYRSRSFAVRQKYSFNKAKYSAPRRASAIVSEALAFIKEIESPESLNNLSAEMKRQMIAELKDLNREWESLRLEAQFNLSPDRLSKYSKEWQRQTKLLYARKKPNEITPECQKAVDTVLKDRFGTSEAESAFILIKDGAC